MRTNINLNNFFKKSLCIILLPYKKIIGNARNKRILAKSLKHCSSAQVILNFVSGAFNVKCSQALATINVQSSFIFVAKAATRSHLLWNLFDQSLTAFFIDTSGDKRNVNCHPRYSTSLIGLYRSKYAVNDFVRVAI